MAARYPMRVIPYDSLTRRLVTSQADPNVTYIVDLLEYNRNGQCTCLGFACKLQPILEKLPPGFCDWEGDHWRCKHIRLVRTALGIELLDKLLEITHDQETKTKEGFVGWSEKTDPTTFSERESACKGSLDYDPTEEIKHDCFSQAKETTPPAQQGDGETDEGVSEASPGVSGSAAALLCMPPSEREEGD